MGTRTVRCSGAGHAQIAQGADGRWYMSHLCSRPVDRFSILGRESAIQNVVWTEDGWFRLQANNQALPELFFDAPAWEQRRDHSQYADFSLGSAAPGLYDPAAIQGILRHSLGTRTAGDPRGLLPHVQIPAGTAGPVGSRACAAPWKRRCFLLPGT